MIWRRRVVGSAWLVLLGTAGAACDFPPSCTAAGHHLMKLVDEAPRPNGFNEYAELCEMVGWSPARRRCVVKLEKASLAHGEPWHELCPP